VQRERGKSGRREKKKTKKKKNGGKISSKATWINVGKKEGPSVKKRNGGGGRVTVEAFFGKGSPRRGVHKEPYLFSLWGERG